MRIGLIDVDGHNYPNLVLMKLSAYHKAKGDTVEWHNPARWYSRVYMSKVFSFSKGYDKPIKAKEIFRGGVRVQDPSGRRCREVRCRAGGSAV